jgi:ParB-like chromosome segregation protein Spo0J
MRLICGHARIMTARQLGITEIPVMIARGWSEAQKRAYVLADNKLALNAGWDPELLRVELGELKRCGFDLSLTGFGDLELRESEGAGLITRGRRQVSILDRQGLAAESCECYRLVRARVASHLPKTYT